MSAQEGGGEAVRGGGPTRVRIRRSAQPRTPLFTHHQTTPTRSFSRAGTCGPRAAPWRRRAVRCRWQRRRPPSAGDGGGGEAAGEGGSRFGERRTWCGLRHTGNVSGAVDASGRGRGAANSTQQRVHSQCTHARVCVTRVCSAACVQNEPARRSQIWRPKKEEGGRQKGAARTGAHKQPPVHTVCTLEVRARAPHGVRKGTAPRFGLDYTNGRANHKKRTVKGFGDHSAARDLISKQERPMRTAPL